MNQSMTDISTNQQSTSSANSSMLLLDSINSVASQSHQTAVQSIQSPTMIVTASTSPVPAPPQPQSQPPQPPPQPPQHHSPQQFDDTSTNINPTEYIPQVDRLADEDTEIIELCQRLFEQTFDLTSSSMKRQVASTLDSDEFTQIGIRKCVKFCMNLPGNNDLCTDDRAKLLKYGVYEIAVC